MKDVLEGKKVDGSVKYLNDLNKYIEVSQSNLKSLEQLLDLDYSLEMYTWLVVKKVTNVICIIYNTFLYSHIFIHMYMYIIFIDKIIGKYKKYNSGSKYME